VSFKIPPRSQDPAHPFYDSKLGEGFYAALWVYGSAAFPLQDRWVFLQQCGAVLLFPHEDEYEIIANSSNSN